jgi:phosphocarrier protein HPr
MQQREVEIVNKLGLHARASAKLTQLAGQHQCEVWLSRNGRRVNAKSIMGVMMLAAECGSSLTIKTDGADAESAMDALLALVADGFHEMHLTDELRQAELRDAEQRETEGPE